MGNTERLEQIVRERIIVLDGAMGTLHPGATSSTRRASAATASGTTRTTCAAPTRLLVLTRPEIIGEHPRASTSTPARMSSAPTPSTRNAISMADYALEPLRRGDQPRRRLDCAASGRRGDGRATPDKPRFVAGSLGPTTGPPRISPDVNDPGARNVTWDQLVAAYVEAARGLVDGRRRHPADRDDLRHAQRQGSDLRGRGAVR